MQVLIAANSLLITQRLKELLEEVTGLSAIYQFTDYVEALDGFSNHKPNVVILDIGFQGKQSFLYLKEIKISEPETVIIILSIDMDNALKEHCIALGADFFLDRYHEFPKIPAIINDLILNRKRIL